MGMITRFATDIIASRINSQWMVSPETSRPRYEASLFRSSGEGIFVKPAPRRIVIVSTRINYTVSLVIVRRIQVGGKVPSKGKLKYFHAETQNDL